MNTGPCRYCLSIFHTSDQHAEIRTSVDTPSHAMGNTLAQFGQAIETRDEVSSMTARADAAEDLAIATRAAVSNMLARAGSSSVQQLPAETCRHCDTRVDIPIRTDFVGLVHNGRKCQCGQTTSFGEIRETRTNETPLQALDRMHAEAMDMQAGVARLGVIMRRDENGETAPEHLRNALNMLRHTGYETLAGWGYETDDLDAIRSRIARALKLLEG